MKELSLDLAAAQDIREAAAWYEEQRSGLGIEFVLEIDAILQRIEDTPEAFPVIYEGFRRALPRRFPYAVYFRFNGEEARVFAVLDQRRADDVVTSRLDAT